MKKNNKNLKKIEQGRNRLQKMSFEFMLQMIFIIGIPAFLAAYFGKKLGVERGNHPKPMIILIALAVIFSWTIILIKFFKINKEIKKTDKEIKSLKE